MKIRIFSIAVAGACMPIHAQQVFRAEARLVEVYATVQDGHGHYVDGLTRDRFRVFDNGVAQPLAAFESNSEGFSCAILLDTTGSMANALPTVRNSVMHVVDELRPEDSIGIFSFSTGLVRLQDFTGDRGAAKQAVLRTRAAGATALFDALADLAYQVAPREGKKTIVVFTDGSDNASLLNARAAVQRAKKVGVPVYAIAEGEALARKELLAELSELATATGGQPYKARKSGEIGPIFEEISRDLQHGYMIAYKPPPGAGPEWRTIRLSVGGLKDAKVRAKQGYFPE